MFSFLPPSKPKKTEIDSREDFKKLLRLPIHVNFFLITESLHVYRAIRHATTQASPDELLHDRQMQTKLHVAVPIPVMRYSQAYMCNMDA